MVKRIIILAFLIFSSVVEAREFSWVSKRLAVLEFPGGKTSIAAITGSKINIYVVTTQSIFLENGTDFVLKDFEGNRLKVLNMEIAPDKDLIRFEIDINHYLKQFEYGGEPSTKYVVNPDYGTVSEKKYSLKGIKESGAVVVDENGAFSGVISFSKGFSENRGEKRVEFLKVTAKSKWIKTAFRTFGTQIKNIIEMKEKVLSMESLKRVNRLNAYIEYQPKYHESHVPWIQDRNKQYETSIFNAGKKGKRGAKAKFMHNARCSHYTGLKRLYNFAGNIVQIDRITKWQSIFLRELSESLSKRAGEIKKSTKDEMDKLIKAYPATKTRT